MACSKVYSCWLWMVLLSSSLLITAAYSFEWWWYKWLVKFDVLPRILLWHSLHMALSFSLVPSLTLKKFQTNVMAPFFATRLLTSDRPISDIFHLFTETGGHVLCHMAHELCLMTASWYCLKCLVSILVCINYCCLLMKPVYRPGLVMNQTKLWDI